MARKTIAEKNAEAAAEKAAKFAELQAAYPQRLMKLMAQYADLPNFSFREIEEASDDKLTFVFTIHRETGWVNDYILQSELVDWDMYYNLENAEYEIKDHYEREAEAQRKYSVLQNAKSKLQATFNKEELELLGLK